MPLHLLAIGYRVEGDSPIFVRPCFAWCPKSGQSPAARWVIHQGLAAAVASPVARSFQPLDQAAILTAIHRHVDILPVRFPTLLPDDEAVRSFLDKHGPTLLQALNRLRGAGEMGLRLELPQASARPDRGTVGDPAHPATSPAEYLALRRHQYEARDRAEEQAQRLIADHVQGLNGLYRDWRRLSSSPPGLVRLAFLVERSCYGAFRERLAQRQTAGIDARCTLLGPWPPYSFV